MLILRVVDPHVKPSNIDESDALLTFIMNKAVELKVDRIELEGDLFHTHNNVRLEVLEFWEHWLPALSGICEVVVLVGNHDISGSYESTYSALNIFHKFKIKNLKIIDNARLIGKIGYIPYIHDNEKFIEVANGLAESGATVLVSHTTYDGCQYETGMYAPGGVNPERIDPRITTLFSGHVHTNQEFGRVIYPGTARWLTDSDANHKKGIWLYTHDNTGAFTNREFISTENVCEPIIGFDYHEGDTLPVTPENAKVLLNLVGSSDWVSKTKSELKGNYRISTKITDTKKKKARKSGKSLLEFLTTHYESKNKAKLISYMQELKLV